MGDRRRAVAVDEAAARFADTLAESYRIVYEQAAEAQERHGRLAQDFSERVLDHLKEQTESGRALGCAECGRTMADLKTSSLGKP